MTERDDPKLVLKGLVESEFDTANTGGESAEFRTGWRDENLNASQVTFGPDEESPTSPTGFTGFDPGGSGPTATVRGTVQAHTWASRDTVSGNPKDAAEAFADEVRRIVRDYYDVSQYSGWPINGVDASNYRYLSYLGRTFMPDEPDDSGGELVFHYVVEVRYEYLDRR